MRMTFLYRTPNVWTPALHKPVEGHIITEVGNFNWLRKDSQSTYSASDSTRVAHCAGVLIGARCLFRLPSPFSKSLLPPSSSQTEDTASHGVCSPSTWTGPMSKKSFIPNFSVLFLEKFQSFNPKGWETVPSAQMWKIKRKPDLPILLQDQVLQCE